MKERIRQIRKHLKLTQENFAQRIGVSRSLLVTYELGRVEPSEIFLKAVCSEFGADYAWLKYGVGEPFRTKEEGIEDRLRSILEGETETVKAMFIDLLSLDINDLEELSRVYKKLKAK